MQVLIGFTCLMCILRFQILPNLEMAVVITASCLKIVCSLMTTLGNFPNPTLSLKDHALKVLCVVSLLFLPLFLFRSFLFFLIFVFSFFLVSLVFPSLLGFVELASIMAQSSHCCQSWDRNSVCCLMYDIDFQLMEAVEVSWDAMVASHYHTCCCLKVCEYTCDHHCSNCSLVLFLFSQLGLGFLIFPFC